MRGIMRVPRTVAVALAFVSLLAGLAGCVEPDALRTCARPTTMDWRQAGVYDALPAAADARNVTLHTPGAVDVPLPLDATAPLARWGESALVRVSFDALTLDAPVRELRIEPSDEEDAYRFRGQVANGTPDATVRDAARAFLVNVSAMDGADRRAWADAFAASTAERNDRGTATSAVGFTHEVTLPRPLDLDALFDAVTTREDAEWSSDQWDGRVRADGWTFTFTFPSRSLTWTEDVPYWDVLATPQEYVRVRVWAETRLAEDEARAWAEGVFADLGLPAPTFDHAGYVAGC